jgi:hypothetical protein
VQPDDASSRVMSDMNPILIDSNGEMDLRTALMVRPELDGLMCEMSAREYLVKNCGYIDIVLNAGKLWIRMRPEKISDLTIATLCYVLSDFSNYRMIGNWYMLGAWNYEVLPVDMESLVDRISNLAITQRVIPLDRILRRTVDPDKLRIANAMSEFWRQVSISNLPPKYLETIDFINNSLNGRYISIRVESNFSIVFNDVGRGIPNCASSWTKKAFGLNVSCQPDQYYGRYCLDAYRKVALSNVPIFEDIDAVVAWPGAAEQRRKYRRIITAARSSDDQIFLLGVSIPERSIDLRTRCD